MLEEYLIKIYILYVKDVVFVYNATKLLKEAFRISFPQFSIFARIFEHSSEIACNTIRPFHPDTYKI